MGINTLFSIGESAVTAQRLAIETTSQNIANVNTEGYSRQKVLMETAPTVMSGGIQMGSGVKFSPPQRVYDVMLQQQLINGSSTSGRNSAMLSSLQQVEPSFNEVANNGLGQAIEDFFNSWHDLSVNPQGAPERQAVLARARVLTDTFHQMNSSLAGAIDNADASLVGITGEITDKASNIASLNQQIRTTEQLGGSANDLRDRRDLLVRELAEKVGITAVEETDGTMTVTLKGVPDGGGTDNVLVSGNQYRQVYTSDNGTDNDIRLTALGAPPTQNGGDPDVTATIGYTGNTLGEIGGALYIRETLIGGDTGYLAKLDELAYTIAEEVNASHAAGFGLDSSTGIDFFAPAANTAPPVPVATSQGYSKDITVSITDTNEIAAADADPAVSGEGNNKQAVLLARLKTTSIQFNSGNTDPGGFFSSFVSSVGIDVQAAKNASQQDAGFLKQLYSLRESNSGVSLDEELTNLIKYQRAFEAAAKTINAATDLMDTVIGLVR